MQPSFPPNFSGVDLSSAFNSVANSPKISVTDKDKLDPQALKTPRKKLESTFMPFYQSSYSRRREVTFLLKDAGFNLDQCFQRSKHTSKRQVH